jgi:hypothetical protein
MNFYLRTPAKLCKVFWLRVGENISENKALPPIIIQGYS